jgi:hypothetical protein
MNKKEKILKTLYFKMHKLTLEKYTPERPWWLFGE